MVVQVALLRTNFARGGVFALSCFLLAAALTSLEKHYNRILIMLLEVVKGQVRTTPFWLNPYILNK